MMTNNEQTMRDYLSLAQALGFEPELITTAMSDEEREGLVMGAIGLAAGIGARRTVADLSDDEVGRFLDEALEVFDLAGSMRSYYDNHYPAEDAGGRRDQLVSLLVALEPIRHG